ncbi:MAG: class I tRNA ligase family protein, partial [Albidovulum sp.]|nr:class I tRNA ligase family protein [Albidovulum sp.]
SLVCAHPFRGLAAKSESEHNRWDFDVPVLAGGHVTDEAGTGFVHTAPSHGVDDYQIGLRHGLAMTHNVLENGAFRDDLPFFGGKRIFTEKGKEGDANSAVIEKLAENEMLVARSRLTHSYPHSWRSKAPLIYRNTPQWFAAIDVPTGDGMDELGTTIRERALKSIVECVQWTPPSGRNRLYSMIENRPDWVLSRQRAWGVPLACFVKKGTMPDDSDFLLRDERVNGRIIEAFEQEGADAWYMPGAKERFLGGDYEPESYEQVFDILDVWFDSGSTHAFVLRDRPDGSEDGIADLYLEGTDQHRGWFHSSMLQACGTIGKAPYRGVLTHGFTLDEKGMKMSKSLGNVVAPDQVVRQYGADILRLWVAQSDYTSDMRIGPEILKGVTDNYRRVRNSFRFMLGNLADYSECETVERKDMPELEMWVLHRLAELDAVVRQGYSKFEFQNVFQALFSFATSDLSSFYFDIRKDVLYCNSADSLERKSALTVLDLLFRRLTLWMAPILSFTMDEVWMERFPGKPSSVHLLDFPETPKEWQDDSLERNWSKLRSVRRVVTSALEIQRQSKIIGSSLEAAPTVFVEDSEILEILGRTDFHDICITSSIKLTREQAPDDAFRVPGIDGIAVIFATAEGRKCQRCWKILPEVGCFRNPGLCQRCDSVVGREREAA